MQLQRGLPKGLLRVAIEEDNFTLASVEGKLVVPTPLYHVRYSFLYGRFSDFFVRVTAEE